MPRQFEECLLGDVLGQAGIPRDPSGGRKHHSGVRLDEFPERERVGMLVITSEKSEIGGHQGFGEGP